MSEHTAEKDGRCPVCGESGVKTCVDESGRELGYDHEGRPPFFPPEFTRVFPSAVTHCANCGGEVPVDKPHKVGECEHVAGDGTHCHADGAGPCRADDCPIAGRGPLAGRLRPCPGAPGPQHPARAALRGTTEGDADE